MKRYRTVAVVVLPAMILMSNVKRGDALVATERYSERVFSYSGALTLQYERNWLSAGNATDRLYYGLNLGFNGFVMDPRVMNFSLGANITQSVGISGGSTGSHSLEGISVSVTLLQDKPIRGLLSHIPQPIRLRYSYSLSDTGWSQRYGLSLEYQFPSRTTIVGRKVKQSASRLPRLGLDYSRYEYENTIGTEKLFQTSDRLRLATGVSLAKWKYLAEYLYYARSEGIKSEKSHDLRMNLDYGNYWKETSTWLDSYNRFFLDQSPITTTFHLANNTSWRRRLGPLKLDSLVITGRGKYFSQDDRRDITLGLNADYTKYFAERFSDTVSAGLSYGEGSESSSHSIGLQNRIHYPLSRAFSITNSLSVAQTESGTSYGLSLGVGGNHRISRFSINHQYTIGYADSEFERVTGHSYTLNISAPLWRKMNFTSQSAYGHTDIETGLTKTARKSLSLTANLYWHIQGYNISLYAGYLNWDETEQGIVERRISSAVSSIGGNLQTMLAKGLSLSVTARYQKRSQGESSNFSSSARLQWRWRKITAFFQYSLLNMGSQLDHRLTMRVTRDFGGLLRPFW